MHFDGDSRAAYCCIKGEHWDLQALVQLLDSWSDSLSPGGKGARVWWPGEVGEVHVFTGAVLAMQQAGVLSWREATQAEEERAACAAEACVFLEQEGLLRSYQAAAVRAALSNPWMRGIIKAPCGAGKTRIACGLTAVGGLVGVESWLYVVGNQELAAQTQRAADELLEQMCEAIWLKVLPRMTCASYGEGANFLQEEGRAVDGLIVDECIPAGTLVGGRFVEDIAVGDLVPGFNQVTGEVQYGRVVKTMRRKPTEMLTIHTQYGPLSCTPEHPIATATGWKSARSITCSDLVLYYRSQQQEGLHAIEENNGRHLRQVLRLYRETPASRGGGTVLPGLQAAAEGRAQEAPHGQLQRVRDASIVLRKAWARARQNWGGVLLRGLQASLDAQAGAAAGEAAEPTAAYSFKRTYAEGQPDEGSNCTGACANKNAPAGVARWSTPWWERAGAAAATALASLHTTLANRVLHCDWRTAWRRIPNVLQGGSWGARPADCYRGRWGGAQWQESQGTGSEEGGVLVLAGVDRIEVHEPGSAGQFGGVCPDGFVYNLEVEGLHTYLAQRVVVHNCHQLPAATRARAVVGCGARARVGLSGTPLDRQDGSNAWVVGMTGPVLHEIQIGELEKERFLSRGKVTCLRV